MADLHAPRRELDPAPVLPGRGPKRASMRGSMRGSLRGRAAAALAVALLGAGGTIALLLPSAGLGPGAMALGGLGLGGVAMLRGLSGYPHRAFGLANAITLGRGAGVAVLAAALLSPPADEATRWALTALAALIFALDGLDGWAARRSGLASRFGARFDVEVDTAFALVLALLVWRTGVLGPWVVLLGLFRPAFLLAGLAWPALRAALPEASWRKTVCVLQIGALILLLAPAMPPVLTPLLALAVLAFLLGSFARDVLWLARAARG